MLLNYNQVISSFELPCVKKYGDIFMFEAVEPICVLLYNPFLNTNLFLPTWVWLGLLHSLVVLLSSVFGCKFASYFLFSNVDSISKFFYGSIEDYFHLMPYWVEKWPTLNC